MFCCRRELRFYFCFCFSGFGDGRGREGGDGGREGSRAEQVEMAGEADARSWLQELRERIWLTITMLGCKQ
ncbi:hypothetical protein CJF31_00000772 [Rutstroemia sp. NJR-2017a BVV2]|nr:hypothetical protein CJF31_00000772 [Rutstroemia sp. NJR-2017a BVV2]